jgi:glycosyltransferase involved in cell wall biosynthesis
VKIALDARWIFPEISGIGAYTRELIRQFARLDGNTHYLLIFQDPALLERTARETGFRDTTNFSTVLVPYGVFSPLNQLRLPVLLGHHDIDLYHSANYMMPLWNRGARAKRVVTIHDLIPMIFRDQVARSRKARMYPIYRRLMLEIGARADAILTDSRASAADIIRLLEIPADRARRVRAIPCGVSERFHPPAARAPKSPSDPRTILYVGRSDPYKNLQTLVRAFALVRGSSRLPIRLVVAGSPDPRYPEAANLARSLGLTETVRWTGYLPDEDLVALYQSADVLAHPSRYEGFGLQVLEAMACGIPVVCSNAASLPEVAGDAALMASPDDAEGFATLIGRVLSDPALAAELSARGIGQARKFTWERTAQETLTVFREVAGA